VLTWQITLPCQVNPPRSIRARKTKLAGRGTLRGARMNLRRSRVTAILAQNAFIDTQPVGNAGLGGLNAREVEQLRWPMIQLNTIQADSSRCCHQVAVPSLKSMGFQQPGRRS